MGGAVYVPADHSSFSLYLHLATEVQGDGGVLGPDETRSGLPDDTELKQAGRALTGRTALTGGTAGGDLCALDVARQ